MGPGALGASAAGTRGLQTYSLAEPENPTQLDRDDTPGSIAADIAAFSVIVTDSKVVLGDGRAGISLFDASVPENPALAGSIDALDRIAGMDVSGTTVYACDDNNGVLIADVSSSEPREIGRVRFADIGGSDQCYDVLVRDSTLYVASAMRLTVMDISTPSSPTVLGLFELRAEDRVLALGLSGNYLLMTTSDADFEGRRGTISRLQVFDVSDASAPTRVWTSEDLGAGNDIAIAGDIAFIAGSDLGVYVFDVYDPSSPFLEGVIKVPGNAAGVAASSGALYVAQRFGGLSAVHTGPLPTVR